MIPVGQEMNVYILFTLNNSSNDLSNLSMEVLSSYANSLKRFLFKIFGMAKILNLTRLCIISQPPMMVNRPIHCDVLRW
jgi:hypothetical protein